MSKRSSRAPGPSSALRIGISTKRASSTFLVIGVPGSVPGTRRQNARKSCSPSKRVAPRSTWPGDRAGPGRAIPPGRGADRRSGPRGSGTGSAGPGPSAGHRTRAGPPRRRGSPPRASTSCSPSAPGGRAPRPRARRRGPPGPWRARPRRCVRRRRARRGARRPRRWPAPREPATVRWPGCTAKPRNPAPSYAMVRRRRVVRAGASSGRFGSGGAEDGVSTWRRGGGRLLADWSGPGPGLDAATVDLTSAAAPGGREVGVEQGQTSSMRAMGALSPWRGPSFKMRV